MKIVLLMAAPEAYNNGTDPNSILSFLPFIFICLLIYLLVIRPKLRKKKQEKINQAKALSHTSHWEEKTSVDNKTVSKMIIPDICPHCKNPNTKKLLECEWCGAKIC